VHQSCKAVLADACSHIESLPSRQTRRCELANHGRDEAITKASSFTRLKEEFWLSDQFRSRGCTPEFEIYKSHRDTENESLFQHIEEIKKNCGVSFYLCLYYLYVSSPSCIKLFLDTNYRPHTAPKPVQARKIVDMILPRLSTRASAAVARATRSTQYT
jgi:hypothetical protein